MHTKLGRRAAAAGSMAALAAAAGLAAVHGGIGAEASGGDATIAAISFATRYVPAASPSTTAQAIAAYDAAPATTPGYCTLAIRALPGAANHLVCAGSSTSIGFHVSVPFTVTTAGTWGVRIGADLGHGGTLLVDGTELVAHWYNMWWGGSWSNSSQLLQGATSLTAGAHRLDVYGFEDCCDGTWGAQLQTPGGTWLDIDTSPPAVTVSGVTATTYDAGAVPAATCRVDDPFDGTLSFPATLSAITGPRAAEGLGTQTAGCAYSDTRSLVSTASVTYTVGDLTPPVITAPAPITVEATSAAGATVTYAASATDNHDGAVTTTCTPPSGATFPLGTTTVACTASDRSGNTATASFTVSVAYPWTGLLQPARSGAGYHLGRTIPVKFTLSIGGGATAHLYVTKLATTTAPASPEQPATSAGAANDGSTFRWSEGQYVYDLDTKPLSAGNWRLRVDLGDGVAHVTTVILD